MTQKYAIVLSLLIASLMGGTSQANADHRGRTILTGATAVTADAIALADTIRGRVTDASDRAPLPGVNVRVGGTSQGTVTDANGRYELALPAGADSLLFSFVGYETARVPIQERSEISVRLKPATYVGEELVVIGYGTQQRRDLTGSVASLREEDFGDAPSYSVEQLIQSKVPGVRTVFSGGQPGSGASINIRGASSINAGTGPLIVVDGQPNPGAVNTADIESIEVLKDASATAIYGARGANGVILITTKGGSDGGLQVDYEGKLGMQRPANTLDLLTPQEYQRVLNGIIEDGGGDPELRVEEIPEGGTDWQDAVLQSAPVQDHNLSFAGGSDETQYRVSLGAFLQEGIVTSSSFERYMARVNLDHEITDKFNFGLRFNALYRSDDYVPNNFGVNENAGALYAAYNYDPTLPLRNENGDYNISPSITTENPMALARGDEREANTYRTYGTFFAEYYLLPSLSAKVRIAADLTSRRQDRYISRLTKVGRATGGTANITENQDRDYLLEATATYDKSFANHNLTVLGGVTAERFYNEDVFTQGEGFPSDVTGTKNLGLADPETIEGNSFASSNQLLSYIGRVNYTLLDKYLLTTTMRIDGSSRFGENEKFGYFPSAALGWRMHQEVFMEGVDFISTLKPRVSWGRTGNQAIGNYEHLVTLAPGPSVVWDDQEVATTGPARFGNPSLKWETTEQVDIGLDFGFWQDRVTGAIDYYRKDTYDMLVALPVPNSTGFQTQLTNIGSIKNSGFEVSLSSQNVVGDFNWTTDLNFATLNNEVEDLGPISEIIGGGAGFTSPISIITPGLPLRTYYGYEIEGVWQEDDDFSQTKDNVQPGNLRYRDVNGDSTVTADDRVPLGDSFPDLTFSIGNTFHYKNVELHFLIDGMQGGSMLNNNLVDTYFPVNFRRNKFAEPYLNRWTPENPSDKYPSFVSPLSQGNRAVNSYTVQDASYVRLQTVRLSYTLPRQSRFYRAITIYLTGENLYTISNYDGLDPAVAANNNANFRIDYNTYPSTKTYTLGVRLGL